jgi:3-phenylpropionate/trans-cinnamate dioxygenase ferredoxin reductase subunit
MIQSIVIVGAGQAAAQLVSSLRAEGFDGAIAVVGDEAHPPYQRPPLSKSFLSGTTDIERLYIRSAEFYEAAGVDLHLGSLVAGIDRGGRSVTLGNGECLRYDRLVLATGARARRLPVPGADLDGVFCLRTIADTLAIRARIRAGARVAIIGGGYLGLEAAAVATKLGIAPIVLEAESALMSRVVCSEVSRFFAGVHKDEGVVLRTNARVVAFDGRSTIGRVMLADGTSVEADMAIVGIGILPNVELAAAAGLATDNGILVDEVGRTSDPAIYAAGDCANQVNHLFGRRLRLESVQNAIEQAKTVAVDLCDKPRRRAEVPWFWSDQYELKLQIAGLSQGYDDVVMRNGLHDRSFAAFYLQNGRLIAVDAVQRPSEFMLSKSLIAQRAEIPSALLADASISMKEIASRYARGA